MAKVIEFDIDGYISSYGYNSRYVKSFLKEAGKDQVICHLCSLGGEFLVGVSIKDEFSKHGNVLVDISGYAASAATFIALGAKHTRMSESSFYLIHKVLSWVDAWGSMNEDQISELISDLEKIKDENEKMTLVAAKAYADKSGKSITDILNLMKQDTWLTADEAKEWGFVDEVYKTTTRFDSSRVSEKFNALGLPRLPSGERTSSNLDVDTIVNKVVSGIKNIMPKKSQVPETNTNDNHNQKTILMTKFDRINSILKVEHLESTDGQGCYLNATQLQALEDAISQRDQQISNIKQCETEYNNAVTTLNELHPDIAAESSFPKKINVIREKLAAKPGTPISGIHEQKHKEDGVDWEKLNSMKHMQE